MKHQDSDILGKFTGDATPVQPEELVAAYARIAELERCLRALHEDCSEYIMINNLSGAFNNHVMRQAYEALQPFPGEGAYSL